MPLGGGQSVGASCYYLKLGDANLILDAGIGIKDGVIYEPDIYSLMTSPFIQSLNQLDHIYISHAHMDHVGYLLKLMKNATNPSVYMTEITALLSEYQLYDRNFLDFKEKDEEKRLAAQSLLNNIVKVSYMKTMDFGKYKVTFFSAGHIPGAMMMLFEFGKKKILYTGDYSLDNTALTNGCMIPSGLDIDLLIMCGLHAKHPEYTKKQNSLFKNVQDVLKLVSRRYTSVVCHISQLSKGIEFLKTLNQWNHENIPIYIDEEIMRVIYKMERLFIPILSPHNRVLTEKLPKEPHIVLTSKKGSFGKRFYQDVNVDFSLHEDFEEMRQFIKAVNPKKAVLVHCGKSKSVFDETIEQRMMIDGECRTQFIFAEDKEIYKL